MYLIVSAVYFNVNSMMFVCQTDNDQCIWLS